MADANYRVPTMIKMVFIRQIIANLNYNFFKLDFFGGDEKKSPATFGELQGFIYFGGVLLLFGEGGLDCFFVEHCAGGFGFVCAGFVFAVEADALVDDVEFHVFNCSVGHVAYTCGG